MKPVRPAKRGARKVRRPHKQRRKGPAPPDLAHKALDLLLAQYDFDTVLDVGCGDGSHARVLRAHGKRVTTISLEHYGDFAPDFVGDVFDFETAERFDVVWCSHVLEHQANVGLFLRRVASLARPGGILAITVPPPRRSIVGGHLTVWNTGLLLYNLVVAGIDCREARTCEYNYNVSVVVRLRPAALPPLRHDVGDIERLAPFFPMPVQQGFDGKIGQIRWSDAPDTLPTATLRSHELDPARFLALPAPHPSDLDTLVSVASSVHASGHVLEFGVFKGRSLRRLAQVLPGRAIHGFDSFEGLPMPWKRSESSVYPTGHFKVDAAPAIGPNVTLWPGFFEDTLPKWLTAHEGPVALIHVDCDLYSSTKTVLTGLDSRIVPGTVIAFDELCDWEASGVYPCWRDGEWKALVEWAQAGERTLRVVARGPRFAGAVEVVN